MTKEGVILIALMSVTLALVLIALIYFRCRYTAQKERIEGYLSVARHRMEAHCDQLSSACATLDLHTSRSTIAIATSLRSIIQEGFNELKQEIGSGLDECYSVIEQKLNPNDDQQAPSISHI